MSKGAGALAVGGGGGGGSIQVASTAAIEAVGGVSGAQAGTEGMRAASLEYWRGVFEGKTTAEANRIAADVIVYGPRGGIVARYRGTVKL
jgi:hypothetical protein